jgi:uncharacterized membrane protein
MNRNLMIVAIVGLVLILIALGVTVSGVGDCCDLK